MSEKQSASWQVGGGFWAILFFIFLVLKLNGTIDWSWWCVTAPLWAPTGLFIFLATLFILVSAFVGVFGEP